MKKIQPPKVEQVKVEKYNPLVSYGEMEEKSSVYIKRFSEKQHTDIKIDFNGEWLLFCWLADQHLGNYGTDYTAARLHAEMIAACPFAFGIGAGDYIDNFISSHILDALINQTTSPKQQVALFKEYIAFFKGKLILMISGNHDRWSKSVSGLDFLAPLARENLIQYSPDVFHFTVKVGKVQYKFCARHKGRFNSSYNLTHSVKQLWRMGDEAFDIGCIAHHHEPAIEQCYIQDQELICVRPGTYKVADTFARKIGVGHGRAVMPCVAVNTKAKRMVPFFHLEDGIDFVTWGNK